MYEMKQKKDDYARKKNVKSRKKKCTTKVDVDVDDNVHEKTFFLVDRKYNYIH